MKVPIQKAVSWKMSMLGVVFIYFIISDIRKGHQHSVAEKIDAIFHNEEEAVSFKEEKCQSLSLKISRFAHSESSEESMVFNNESFRKEFKRRKNDIVLNKLGNKINVYWKIKAISARERFTIIFHKVRVILLFMYMLRRVKFYGLNILKSDIQLELERFKYLNLDFKTPVAQAKKNELTMTRKFGTLMSMRSECDNEKSEIERGVTLARAQTQLKRKPRRLSRRISKMIIIHPDHCFMIIWNFFIVMGCWYTVTVMPFIICFYHIRFDYSVSFIFDEIVNTMFIFDFLIHFVLGYYDEKKELILTPGKIIMNYLQTWMFIDLLSIFPFYFLPMGILESNICENYSNLLRLFKLFRIFRLYRIASNEFIKKYTKIYKLQGGVKRSILAVISLILFAHIFACLWYFIAKFENDDYDTWITHNGMQDAEKEFLYITALYYSLTVLSTVGYGDVVACTNPEKVFAIVCMMLGAVSTSFLISNVVTVISNYDIKNISVEEKIATLNKFATRIKLRNETYTRIKKSFEDSNLNEMREDQEEILRNLPHYLRIEIILYIHQQKVKDIFFFRERDKKFIVDIILAWKKVYFKKNEFIYFSNETPEEVYFLIRGYAIYVDDDGNIITKFGAGAILGEVEVSLSLPVRFLNLQCVNESSDMNAISREDFKNILLKYSSEFISTLKMSNKKYHKYLEIIRKVKVNGLTNECLKKKLSIFKTTKTYLNEIKSAQNAQKKKDSEMQLEIISELSSFEKDDLLSVSIHNRSNNNNLSGLENSLYDADINNNSSLARNPQPENQTKKVSFNINLSSADFNNHNNNICVPSGTKKKFSQRNVNVQNLINSDAELKIKKYEKSKLNEVIYIFDKFIYFIASLNKTFCSHKTKIDDIAKNTKDISTTIDGIDQKIQEIQQKQSLIESNFHNKMNEFTKFP